MEAEFIFGKNYRRFFMNITKNKSLAFLSLFFILVISFVISITSFCSNKNVVLAQDNSEQVYEEDFACDSVIV